jgi:hypothetical protein
MRRRLRTVSSAFSRMEQVLMRMRSDSSMMRVGEKPGFGRYGGYDFAVAEIHLAAIALYIEALAAWHRVRRLEEHLALLAFIYIFGDAHQGGIVVVHDWLKFLQGQR